MTSVTIVNDYRKSQVLKIRSLVEVDSNIRHLLNCMLILAKK